ncbi:NADPH-dependent FMN reductase [Thalassorhabdomicrobium marinisediminis]|uniref:NADPH-dependent FMN reductase n=1 Tax=Thalassorhabdomicrobium marinisediminis TaxID=2170577 RepID=A0A2T7FTB0_9RHOB|nr:NAD(P)H-dependent oxidoreductase [Thalassorhabdomicrobium marinisediminis]PVA05407.1 NADPH-dependent FMN reductase [Thalassorhabdomicrobium marinisediminis]
MTNTLKIITTSTRPGRVGPTVSDWVARVARDVDVITAEPVDLADMELPLLDEAQHPAKQQYEHAHTKRWSAQIAGADAAIFVLPEYDYFAPASFVNAVQCLMLEWKYLPVGVVCYGGVSGGLRSAQEARQLLGNVGAYAIPQTVPVPFVANAIGADGALETNDKMDLGLAGMIKELAKLAEVMKPLRSGIEAG